MDPKGLNQPPDIPEMPIPVVDLDDIPEDDDVDNGVAVGRRGRKRTSDCWDYFDKPVLHKGKQMARCKSCKIWYTAASGSGTSHLNDHWRQRCTKRHCNLEVGQQTLQFKSGGNGETKTASVTASKIIKQDVARAKLLKMIIVHEYPLSVVDHVCFRDFVQYLNPDFKIISRNTLRADIMKTYTSEKLGLKKFLEDCSSRVSITTDMWTTSNQKKSYMAVMTHFIDDEWKLRSRILRFAYVPCPHTKEVLAKVLLDTLFEYGLETKISSVVVDNCTTNDAMMEILGRKFDSTSLILGGDFLHMRCSAHILNLIVKDGLEVIDGATKVIRDNIAFWLATPKRIEAFNDSARALKVPSTKSLSLDCKTRWNSTYLMLQSAFPYKDVFSRAKKYNTTVKIALPEPKHWEMAAKICEKLELFFKATTLFSGKNYPTSNLFFSEVCDIKLALVNGWILILGKSERWLRKWTRNLINIGLPLMVC
ncbi:hypothetical protein RND81_09G063400 [Saponaria officinalis]|uniref:BED-type domain-containing protein n=1 Tax=Saponaria officinalis TaxID=3572 RepID=A0AAW1IHF0_SAPOF